MTPRPPAAPISCDPAARPDQPPEPLGHDSSPRRLRLVTLDEAEADSTDEAVPTDDDDPTDEWAIAQPAED